VPRSRRLSWRILLPAGRHGVSCARLGAASRVLLTRGRTRHSGWRGGVLSLYASTASGMAMQWPGWRRERQGWSHMADRDGGDRSHRPGVTALLLHGRGVAVHLVFEGSASFLKGAARRPYGSGWHSATGLLLTMPHSVTQWRGWPRHGSWRSSAGA
jgi:hypothetical protein